VRRIVWITLPLGGIGGCGAIRGVLKAVCCSLVGLGLGGMREGCIGEKVERG